MTSKEKAGAADPGSPNSPTAYRSVTAQARDTGVSLLLNSLRGVRERRAEWPSWTAFCPCHHDTTNRSLQIDYKAHRDSVPELPEGVVLVWCHVCGKRVRLAEVCKELGLAEWRVHGNNGPLDALIGNCALEPARLPTPAEVEGYEGNLWASSWVEYLVETRGLDEKTIRRHRVGHDHFRFTLPVYGPDGRIVNVRTYSPDTAPKMIGLRGRGIQLYPSLPYRDPNVLHPFVVLCEGEWDALVCRRHGIIAVTSTGGVQGWKPEWTGKFAGLDVAVIFDCDESAHEEGFRRAEELGDVVRRVKVVDLGLGRKEDLTDWFVKYGRTRQDLVDLIRSTPLVQR